MPKRSRISGSELRGMKPARRIHGVLFSLSFSSLPGKAKATIVVSKKVSAKAVDRNLLKRRARAALSPLLKMLPGGAYVFSAKAAAKDAVLRDIEADITVLARKIA